jgi:hypothetical protein
MNPNPRLARPRVLPLVALATLAMGLGGCADARRAMGWEKAAPDEFRVVSRAPLSLPPDYALRPPQPGAARPQEASTQLAARQAVLSSGGGPLPIAFGQDAQSEGERALLARAGGRQVDPRIRETVDRESVLVAEAERRFVDRLIFWRSPEEPGVVVDATREAQRIRENAALGRGPNEGGDTPVIRRRQRGLLEGIF